MPLRQADKVIGVKGVMRALIGVINDKAHMVILNPCGDVLIPFEFVGFGRFPFGVEDHTVNVGFLGVFPGAGGVPNQHVGSRAERVVGIHDQFEGFGIGGADCALDVLPDLAQVEGDDQTGGAIHPDRKAAG